MKITEETTAEEVNAQTKRVFYAMCDYGQPGDKGISDAGEVMDDFMGKLENNEFSKDTEPAQEDGFEPTDDEADRIINGYKDILEEIKKLKLR